MTRLSRTLMGVAFLTGLAAWGNPTARAAEPDKLLPADTDTVISVNLKQIVESEVVKKYALEQIKQTLDGQDFKQLFTDIGLDPLKDLEKIVVASIETKFEKQTEPKYVVIVRGKFDPEKLFKKAEDEARKNADRFAMIKDGGAVMFKYQPEGADALPIYATVVDDKTVVAASEKKYITTAIKAADSGKAAPLKKDLAELIKKADDKASLYAVSLLSGKLNDLKIGQGAKLPIKLDGFESALPNAETVILTVKMGADVSLDITLGMKNDESANDMRNSLNDLIEQGKGLLKLGAALDGNFKAQAEELLTILNGTKATSTNKDVNIKIQVTNTNIGRIIKKGKD